MKENSKEISAIGLKMKKMEQKDSWMPQKTYFGSGMTMTIHGFREDSKEEEQGKEKEKEEKEKVKEKDDKDEDFSDHETKEKEKEREKARVTLQVMRVIGLMMNGKEMKQTIGMKAIGPMKMKQHGSPKHGMNGKKITHMMSTDTSKVKERKERKEKEKERKVMDLKIKEKDKVMGKVKQIMWTHHILLNNPRSKQLYLRHRMPPVSLWHIHLCT